MKLQIDAEETALSQVEAELVKLGARKDVVGP
jgi:hypothetical protein